MKAFAPTLVGLVLVAVSWTPGAVAVTSQAVVHVLTDTGDAWESSPVTVDDVATRVRAVQGPGTFSLEFDGPAEFITAVLTGSALGCGLDIDENGQNYIALYCHFASRLWYVENCDSAVTTLVMTITPCALGGYAEVHALNQTNDYVTMTHEIRKTAGQIRFTSNTCYVALNLLECPFADPGPQAITVACPDTVWAWTNVTTPDGFLRSDLDTFQC